MAKPFESIGELSLSLRRTSSQFMSLWRTLERYCRSIHLTLVLRFNGSPWCFTELQLWWLTQMFHEDVLVDAFFCSSKLCIFSSLSFSHYNECLNRWKIAKNGRKWKSIIRKILGKILSGKREFLYTTIPLKPFFSIYLSVSTEISVIKVLAWNFGCDNVYYLTFYYVTR